MKLQETDCQSAFVEGGPCEGEAQSNFVPPVGGGPATPPRPPQPALHQNGAEPALESASGGEGADTTLSKLQKCQTALGYAFKDVSFLESALIHTSCKLEYNGSNERLEFMGDAILGMVISEHLYKAFPEYCEGELTRIKSVVVSQVILARAGDRLNLGEYVVVGKGLPECKNFPRSLIANVFEAIIAAIYLDGGLSAGRDFVVSQLGEEIARVCHSEHEGNYKSLLQQHCQKHLGTTPHYRLTHQHGPEHGKTFEVAVIIKDTEYCHGKGKSKKQAEQLAAEATYRELTQQEHPVGAG